MPDLKDFKAALNYFTKIFSTPKRRLSFLLILFAIIPIIFSSSMAIFIQQNADLLFDKSLLNYILFYTFTMTTMAFALTPTTFIAILSGYFYSWWGLIGVVISYIGASLIGLLLGRRLNRWFVGGFLSEDERLGNFFSKMKEKGFLMVVFGRLSPILPFAMMNIAFSSIRIQLPGYIAGSFIGMLPRTFVFFYTGKNADEIWNFLTRPSLDGFLAVTPLLLIIVSTIGLLWLVRKSYGEK